jgi:hypothetical protein
MQGEELSPKGCLSTSFLLLLSLWSLLVGGLIVAGWIGAGLLEFFLRAALADLSGARHVAQEVLDMLRAIGFGAMAGLWPGAGRVIDIEAVVVERHEARGETRTDGRDDGPGRLPPRP